MSDESAESGAGTESAAPSAGAPSAGAPSAGAPSAGAPSAVAVEGDAVVAAAAAKAGLVWVGVGDRPTQSLWHVWHDGAVLVVVGGREQPDPVGDAEVVRLMVPSKDTRAHLVETEASVEQVRPDDDRWVTTTAALSASRLNAVDAPGQLDAWASGSRVLRLVPLAGATVGATADAAAGQVRVDIEAVRPRGWRPLRSRLLPRRR